MKNKDNIYEFSSFVDNEKKDDKENTVLLEVGLAINELLGTNFSDKIDFKHIKSHIMDLEKIRDRYDNSINKIKKFQHYKLDEIAYYSSIPLFIVNAFVGIKCDHLNKNDQFALLFFTTAFLSVFGIEIFSDKKIIRKYLDNKLKNIEEQKEIVESYLGSIKNNIEGFKYRQKLRRMSHACFEQASYSDSELLEVEKEDKNIVISLKG